MSIHPKCLPHVHTSCSPVGSRNEPTSNVGPLRTLPFLFYIPLQFVLIRGFHIAPSMFGRDLIEQVRADAKGGERYFPVIVEKCIDAVDALGELSAFFNTSLGL